MGTCPHCRAVTLPGDAVCYTCGRFLKGEGKGYSMPNAPKKRGVVVDQKGRTRNIMQRRRNRQRSVVMLAFVIFAFLSPKPERLRLEPSTTLTSTSRNCLKVR